MVEFARNGNAMSWSPNSRPRRLVNLPFEIILCAGASPDGFERLGKVFANVAVSVPDSQVVKSLRRNRQLTIGVMQNMMSSPDDRRDMLPAVVRLGSTVQSHRQKGLRYSERLTRTISCDSVASGRESLHLTFVIFEKSKWTATLTSCRRGL